MKWLPEQDERLRAMVAEHLGYDEIAAALGRTVNAVRIRANRLGLHVDPAVAKQRKTEGLRKWLSTPEGQQRRYERVKHLQTPEVRAKRTRHIVQYAGGFKGRKHRPETIAKLRLANRKRREREIGLPQDHRLRPTYDRWSRQYGARLAREMIQLEIGKLPVLEQQLLKLEIGKAAIIDTRRAK